MKIDKEKIFEMYCINDYKTEQQRKIKTAMFKILDIVSYALLVFGGFFAFLIFMVDGFNYNNPFLILLGVWAMIITVHYSYYYVEVCK